MKPVGALRERLVIERMAPPSLVVALTRAGSVATATTVDAHHYETGDLVTHAGADQAGYNVKAKVTVTGTFTYTFAVSGAPASPATGSPTSTYTSDVLRGRSPFWRTLDAVPAEMLPQRAGQGLQAEAIQTLETYRFRVRIRGDITTHMRARWTPTFLSGSAPKVLGIIGILPIDDGRQWMAIDAMVIPS